MVRLDEEEGGETLMGADRINLLTGTGTGAKRLEFFRAFLLAPGTPEHSCIHFVSFFLSGRRVNYKHTTYYQFNRLWSFNGPC